MPYKDPEKKRAWHTEYTRELRHFRKANHYCIQCGEKDAYTMNGRARCAECTELAREYNAGIREKRREVTNANGRRTYEDRKQRGVCVACGKDLDVAGYTRCSRCRAKDAARHRRGDMRGVGGLCTCCGKVPAEAGRKLCPTCYENACAGLEKGRAMQNRDNHFWRRDEQIRIMKITGRAAV